jgi:hypothetical protein
MNDKQMRQRALEILKAATRDARRGGFRLFRSTDEKKVAKWMAEFRTAMTVIEQHRRAEILANTAAWMEKKYLDGAPGARVLLALGFKTKQLRAIRAVHGEAVTIREKAAPVARKIEAGAGWFPKTIAKEAREIAAAPGVLRGYAGRYANELEAAGGNAQHLRQLVATLKAAERTKDAATIAEAVLHARELIAQHERRQQLADGSAEPLRKRGGMDDPTMRELAADALRERADALEAAADAADADGDRAKRDALNRALVELRTAAQQLRDARTPEQAEAARKRAADAAASATRAEGGEVAQVQNRTAGARVEIDPAQLAEQARQARERAGALAERMAKIEAGLRRTAQRGIDAEGEDHAFTLGRLREQLIDAAAGTDARRLVGAFTAASSAADRDERTVAVADAMFGERDAAHDRGPEVSR